MEKNILQSDSTQIKQLSIENPVEQLQQREFVENSISEEQQFKLNNQKTTQNDLIQTRLDKHQSNFQLGITQDVFQEKLQQKQEHKDDKENEEHKLNEQNKLQEEEKVDQIESEEQQKRELNTQQQQSQSKQTKINEYIQGIFSLISTEQEQQFISMLQDSNKKKTLEKFSDFFSTALNIKENFGTYIQKQNSQNISLKNFQDLTTYKMVQILNKSDFDSEQTIKKQNKKKKDNEKQNDIQQIQNIYEVNLIDYIINSSNNIYSFNDQNQSNDNDQIEKYQNIMFQINMILPDLYKLESEAKRLSIVIDQSKHPTLMFDSILEICKCLNINVYDALYQQNFNLLDELQLQQLNQQKSYIKQIVDMVIKICDIYIEEVEIRETLEDTNFEYKKELRQFHELLNQTKVHWVGVKNKHIEIQPIRDEQLDLIKRQLQNSDQELLNKVNDELKLRNFYLVSFLTNGGEADILKGYQFIQNIIKQDCIFRWMSIDSESFEQQKQEYELVRSIQSPKNIIQYLDYIPLQDDNSVVFVVEKCQFSLYYEFSLFQSRNIIEEYKLIQIVFDLIEGLIEMRIHKIVHGDIKPANILITQKGYYVYSDFGLANIAYNDDIGVEYKGHTPSYSPPEQINKDNITYKSDIYSLGKSIIKLINIINRINYSEQTRNICSVLSQIANDYMVQDDPKQRYDCLEIFLKFYEKIFTHDHKRFLEIYLKKIKLIITNSDFELSYNSALNNFDYEYYKKTLYIYCMLYIRITFFINGTIIDQTQLEEQIQNNSLDDICNYEVAFSIERIGDYFKIQNDYKKALQCYKQSFNIYKILETSSQVITSLNQITWCYIEISKMNEGLQYLLEENELCQTIFENNYDIAQSFDWNIRNICQRYLKEEKDLQNILEGLKSLNQYKKQFFLNYIFLSEKVIQIYKMKNDIQNELKQQINLFQTKLEYLPRIGYNTIVKSIDDIIQLHEFCQQDYSYFIIEQLQFHVANPNSDVNKKRLYLLHSYLGKYYYKNNNIESSLDEFLKSINIQESVNQWYQKEQLDLIPLIQECFINLNKLEEYQLFLFKYPHLNSQN